VAFEEGYGLDAVFLQKEESILQGQYRILQLQMRFENVEIRKQVSPT
jgi:hypothetical protein